MPRLKALILKGCLFLNVRASSPWLPLLSPHRLSQLAKHISVRQHNETQKSLTTAWIHLLQTVEQEDGQGGEMEGTLRKSLRALGWVRGELCSCHTAGDQQAGLHRGQAANVSGSPSKEQLLQEEKRMGECV